MKKILITTLLLTSFIFSSSLLAQDFEFRIVNKQNLISQNIRSDFRAYLAYKDKLEDLEYSTRESIFLRKKQIEQLDIQSQNLQGNDLSAAKKKIETKLNELEEFVAQMQKQADEISKTFYDVIFQKVDNAIKLILQRENADYVIETHTENGDSIILYVAPDKLQDYDITAKVAEILKIN